MFMLSTWVFSLASITLRLHLCLPQVFVIGGAGTDHWMLPVHVGVGPSLLAPPHTRLGLPFENKAWPSFSASDSEAWFNMALSGWRCPYCDPPSGMGFGLYAMASLCHVMKLFILSEWGLNRTLPHHFCRDRKWVCLHTFVNEETPPVCISLWWTHYCI